MNAPLIRLAQPALDHREARAIEAVLTSGMLVQGAVVERFERAVAERCGRAHAVAVTNGTAALELALECLEVRDHEVLVPDLTWPSPAHAALRAGAEVALLDVDPATWNVTASAVKEGLSPRTKVAIVIDQFGAPAELPGILGGLPSSVALVEDAACAIGSTLFGKPCGSFGAISTLSFHPRKVITTGEGGMLLTDAPSSRRAPACCATTGSASPVSSGRRAQPEAHRDAGRDGPRPAGEARRDRGAPAGDRCALRRGARQGEDPARDRRQRLEPADLRPPPPGGPRSAAVLTAMRSAGVECGRLSYALHRLPSLSGARRASPLTVTEERVERGIALPLHTRMTDGDVEQVLAALLPLLS
jgi:perosamine synthetase